MVQLSKNMEINYRSKFHEMNTTHIYININAMVPVKILFNYCINK